MGAHPRKSVKTVLEKITHAADLFEGLILGGFVELEFLEMIALLRIIQHNNKELVVVE